MAADSPGTEARRELRFLPGPLRHFFEQAPEVNPFTLRFYDPATEDRFQEQYFVDNKPYIRFAHLLGIGALVVFGFLALLVPLGAGEDALLRYGVAVPSVAIALVLSYSSWYPRRWQLVTGIVLVIQAVVWTLHRVIVPDLPLAWDFAGVMLILAFVYVLSRLQFMVSLIVGAIVILLHNAVMIFLIRDHTANIIVADWFTVAFALIGMAAAYGLEGPTRVLFLRDGELELERRRTDSLLRNTLPSAIVDRLKTRGASPQAESIADGYAQVSVLFADLVSFTSQAGKIPPHELVVVLDSVFTKCDQVADRLGMEKIKTIGDAYMAVAGAPEPRTDHAEAAAEMALGILEALRHARWPSGEEMLVRVGIASGPIVAGVIGQRKFAYDLWGDTVNLASRLESNGEPGRILVAETTAELLSGRYELSETCVVQLKGKGPTPANYLIGRTERQEG